MLKVKIKGYRQAAEVLRQFPARIQKSVLRSTLRYSVRPMLREARKQAPSKTGNLRKLIRVVSLRSRKATDISVGIRHAPRKGEKNDAFYGHMIHEGTDDPRQAKSKSVLMFEDPSSGKKIFRKQVSGLKPNKYLDRAYNNTVDRVESEFNRNFQKAVEKYVVRNYKPVK